MNDQSGGTRPEMADDMIPNITLNRAAKGGQPTEDRKLLSWTDRDRAQAAAFTHSDPWRIMRITGEFVTGFDALAGIGPAVTVFGSARTHEGDPMYAAAREVGAALAKAGFATITGGGPGIMEAANRGAMGAGGISVGANIELPFEQGMNRYVNLRAQLPLLLRAQDDVRQVRRGVHLLPRRLRHAGRTLRVADADPDGQTRHVPGRPLRRGILAGAARLDRRDGAGGREDQPAPTSNCSP